MCDEYDSFDENFAVEIAFEKRGLLLQEGAMRPIWTRRIFFTSASTTVARILGRRLQLRLEIPSAGDHITYCPLL